MSIMIDEYQRFCPETFISRDPTTDLLHCIAGMQAEAWEVLEKYKYTTDNGNETELRKEIGGLCYYFAMTCNLTYISMSKYFENLFFDSGEEYGSVEYLLGHGTGTIASAIQKFHRGDFGYLDMMGRVVQGMESYVSAILNLVTYPELFNILEANKQILLDRKQRGQIKGDGDNR